MKMARPPHHYDLWCSVIPCRNILDLGELPVLNHTQAAKLGVGVKVCLIHHHRNTERFFRRMTAQNSDDDLATLARPEIKKMLIASYLEATRAGVRSFAREAVIFSHPWGFVLGDITIPVHLWHEETDANVLSSRDTCAYQTVRAWQLWGSIAHLHPILAIWWQPRTKMVII